MDVFICWSGEQSNRLAASFRWLLKKVIQGVDPFLSTEDIRAGQRWGLEIGNRLSKAKYGVLCLTPEAIDSPWLHFEAGALAKSVETGYIAPILVGLSALKSSLADFQGVLRPTKEEFLKLLTSINKCLEKPLGTDDLRENFDAWWPKFEDELTSVVEAVERSSPAIKPPRADEVAGEVLGTLRGVASGLSALRQEVHELHTSLALLAGTGRGVSLSEISAIASLTSLGQLASGTGASPEPLETLVHNPGRPRSAYPPGAKPKPK
jgi:hypothetical protein